MSTIRNAAETLANRITALQFSEAGGVTMHIPFSPLVGVAVEGLYFVDFEFSVFQVPLHEIPDSDEERQ